MTASDNLKMKKRPGLLRRAWKWAKRMTLAVTLLIAAFLLWHYEHVGYGLSQAAGQVGVIAGAKPVEEYLSDPDFPEEKKAKIKLIGEIKAFAVERLGIAPSGSYETLYDQKGEPLIWNVTACKPFALESHQWKFPIFGEFGYKGYFDKAKANAERARLDSLGYDTRLGRVSAWSTLGILNDPILSGMLDYEEGRLASLVIHELTHGTLFVKNSLAFNENLANFVGYEGALRFLAHRYGEDSPEYRAYLDAQTDRKTYVAYVNAQAQRLDSLYASFPEGLPEGEKRLRKARFIDGFVEGFGALDFKNERYYGIFDKRKPNNAYFVSFLRYDGQQNRFREEFEREFDSDFPRYMAYLKKKYKPLF